MPHSAASDLGLHCLSVTRLGVFSLQWVIFMKHSKCIRGETIHRIHGASLFSGHDSVHDSFFSEIRYGLVHSSVNKSCQLAAN